ESFNVDRGWDQIVTDMVTAEGDTVKHPQGVFFNANRDSDVVVPNRVTQEITKLFMGTQMQCAECHDHKFTHEWKHDDFWGIAAFFGRVRTDEYSKKTRQGPKNITIYETLPETAKGKKKTPPPVGMIGIPSTTDLEKIVRVVPAKYFEGTVAGDMGETD